jgi:hypothetical protein
MKIPDGLWFDGQDEHGRYVQHQYKFDKNSEHGTHLALAYKYDGQLVETGIEFDTESVEPQRSPSRGKESMSTEKTTPATSRASNCSDAPTLTGRWRVSEGLLCCGTLRIAKFDFDTDPSDEFKQGVYKQILDGLNGKIKGCQAGQDGECVSDQCPQRVARQSHCPLPHWTDDQEY